MKRYLKISLLLGLCFLFFVLAPPVAKAEEHEFKEMKVNVVDDVNQELLTEQVSIDVATELKEIEKVGFSKSFYYTFTLEQPSYISLREFMNIIQRKERTRARVYVTQQKESIDSVQPLFSNFVSQSDYNLSAGQRSVSYNSIFDAGTYYVKLDIANAYYYNSDILPAPYFFFSVAAQPITNAAYTRGTNKQTAIQAEVGAKTGGVISSQVRTQYFAFEIKKDAKVTICLAKQTLPAGWNDLEQINVEILDSSDTLLGKHDRSGEAFEVDVKRGINYIKVSTSQAAGNKSGVQEYNIELTVKEKQPEPEENNKPLTVPKLLKFVKGTKLIRGKATEGAMVYITVAGKKYTVKATDGGFKLKLKSKLKKGTVIRVYAKSGTEKTKSKTYKVN